VKQEENRVPPLLPSQQVLARFSVHDRKTLARLLAEPVEYITNDSFSHPDTSATLFGDVAESFATPRPWMNAAEVEAPPIGNDRLSDEDERSAFLRLNYARYRIRGILDSARARRLTPDEATELLTWFARSESVRIHLIQVNMPLVLAMAKRARLGNVDYAELISEGNMALLRSVDKFDCGRGFKFSTYGCRAILKSFSRVAIRTSRYRGRFPTEFDPTLERSDHQDQVRAEVESDCVGELRDILTQNVADLTEVERRVLNARFALKRDAATPATAEEPKPQTLEQVGQMIGVTKERVRQIQNKALGKLKAALQDSILAA
jgi:RNA polymerase sigma factor (sigma-70 family)